jgi:hypothetical protein
MNDQIFLLITLISQFVAYRRVREANEKEGTKYLTSAEMKKGMIKDNKQKLSKTERAAQRGTSFIIN